MADYRGAAPLDERVEFFSDEWVASAKAQLERLVQRNQSALQGVRYSLCEAFSNAPPHLGLEGNLACWTLRFADGGVQVSAGATMARTSW